MTNEQIRLFSHNCAWTLIQLIISMSIGIVKSLTSAFKQKFKNLASLASTHGNHSINCNSLFCSTHNPPEDIFIAETGNTGHSTRTTRVTGCSIVMQSANSHHLHDFSAAPFLCTMQCMHCLSLILSTQLPSPTETFCPPPLLLQLRVPKLHTRIYILFCTKKNRNNLSHIITTRINAILILLSISITLNNLLRYLNQHTV